MTRTTTVEQVLERVKPGSQVLLHSALAEPQTLLAGLMAGLRAGQDHLQNVTLYTFTYRGAGSPPPLYADLELLQAGRFRLKSFFPHSSLKEVARAGLVDYIPASLSMLPGLLRRGQLKIDLAMLQISPPDDQGQCSTGPSSDLVAALVDSGLPLLGEMNHQMPFTYGATVPFERFAAVVETDRPLLEMPSQPAGELERTIAAHVMEYIADGATVQLGIGNIPEAVLDMLKGRRNLNLHSGALTDGVVDLVESGAVTNATKPFDKGQTVAGFLLGSRKLFDFAHHNPQLKMAAADYCNNPMIVGQLPDFVSINSALEVDYWGQVNAEALGDWQLAGVGGQLDYIQGAWNAPGGLSIIALPSTTPGGKPRIVPALPAGAPISTPRFMTQLVITEKGVADLRGKSLSERRTLLEKIA